VARLSRRSIADYVASSLISGTPGTQQLFREVAAFLVTEKRTKELELIVRDIEYALSESGHVRTNVLSAHELSEAAKDAIAAFVRTETGGSDVQLTNTVDPSVLGGMKITVPGRELDQTVARQLTVLKTSFKKV